MYYFNWRDLNNVLTTANFSAKVSSSTLPVELDTLGGFAAINALRRHFPTDFDLGNINPPIWKDDLFNTLFLDMCTYDAVMNNQKIPAFKRKHADNIVEGHNLLVDAELKAATHSGTGPNLYQAFVDFWNTGEHGPLGDVIGVYLKAFFQQRRLDCLVVKPGVVASTTTATTTATTVTVAAPVQPIPVRRRFDLPGGVNGTTTQAAQLRYCVCPSVATATTVAPPPSSPDLIDAMGVELNAE
ncbi:MAG: hypothetical protein IPJ18_20225 [Betaproteobacteria bacterium]|nr:hypothetical protein [Betaproteobacteria bacterium]